MTILMPLLEMIDLLVTFAQKRDVYVCNFVAAFKIAEGQLYTLFIEKNTAYNGDELRAMKNILDYSYSQIHLKWVFDLNNESTQLVLLPTVHKFGQFMRSHKWTGKYSEHW